MSPSGQLLSNYVPGMCADDTGWSKQNGAVQQIWSCTGWRNQQWTAVGVGGPDSNGDYTYTVVNANSNKCLDDTGWNTKVGTLVQQWTCTGWANQVWAFKYLSTACNSQGCFTLYELRNLNSNLCLTSPGTADGTQLMQYPCP